jgi:hypothetical protein
MILFLKIIFFKGKCRNGWTRYKHKCLKLISQRAQHSEAENSCQSIGATLISIHSAEENKFVKGLAYRERTKDLTVWIGAKRNNSLNYFEWTNEQAFNYSNWGSGQPTNSTDPESHVTIHKDGTWKALGKPPNALCYAQPYMCESDLSLE